MGWGTSDFWVDLCKLNKVEIAIALIRSLTNTINDQYLFPFCERILDFGSQKSTTKEIISPFNYERVHTSIILKPIFCRHSMMLNKVLR